MDLHQIWLCVGGQPSMNWGGAHEVPRIAEKLLVSVATGGEKEDVSFREEALEWLPMLQ